MESRGPGADLLTLEDVSVGYADRTVLSGVTLSIAEGQYWFFLGPNGSGKSTLVKAILGGLPARSGRRCRDR